MPIKSMNSSFGPQNPRPQDQVFSPAEQQPGRSEIVRARRPVHDPAHSPAPAEQHIIDLESPALPNVTIRLALEFNPVHVGDYAPTASHVGPATSTASTMQMVGGVVQYGGYKALVRERFLADVDHFLTSNPKWSKVALLLAGERDHRIMERVEKDGNYRIDSLEQIADAMNRAVRGEIQPDSVRNIRSGRSAQRAAAAAEEGSTEDQKDSGNAAGRRSKRPRT